eukprot:UN32042
MKAIAKSECTDNVSTWLKSVLPAKKEGEKIKYKIAVDEPNLGSSITTATEVTCRCDAYTKALFRSVRRHLPAFTQQKTNFEGTDLMKASVGLGHEYSRAKVEFDTKADDNHIVHAISLLDDLNKTLNGMCQRVREWYGWHFPELSEVVEGQVTYCQVCKIIGDRTKMDDSKKEQLGEIFEEPAKVNEIVMLAQMSMVMAYSPLDVDMVGSLNDRCLEMSETRDMLQTYLDARMNGLAPNLTEVIGSTVGAKLIAHTGSLIKLAKCPASTIQVLGAEKALFRALKARSGKTPKYGLIFGST